MTRKKYRRNSFRCLSGGWEVLGSLSVDLWINIGLSTNLKFCIQILNIEAKFYSLLALCRQPILRRGINDFRCNPLLFSPPETEYELRNLHNCSGENWIEGLLKFISKTSILPQKKTKSVMYTFSDSNLIEIIYFNCFATLQRIRASCLAYK